MRAKDLMKTLVLSVRETDSAADLLDALVGEHIHGAPVVDGKDGLVGVVTQQDLFFASVTQHSEQDPASKLEKTKTKKSKKKKENKARPVCVGDIMTSPAVSAEEDTEIRELCRTMSELRIHRIPITRDGRLVGIVSSLDVCAAVSDGADF